MLFKVGEIVRATTDNYMFTTRSFEWEGEVTRVEKGSFSARTTHTSFPVGVREVVGTEFDCLDYDDFEAKDSKESDPSNKKTNFIVLHKKDAYECVSRSQVEGVLTGIAKKGIGDAARVFEVSGIHDVNFFPVFSGLPQEQKKKE